MKVWITKYALTQGIFECEVAMRELFGKYIVIPKYLGTPLGIGRILKADEWTTKREIAVDDVEYMRQKKIESLKKQIKKLEVMKFE